MKVTQLYTLINNVTREILGDTAVVNEDLSNVVDIGKAVFEENLSLKSLFDNLPLIERTNIINIVLKDVSNYLTISVY